MHLNIITTLKCNFKCKHCIFECPSGDDLRFNDFKKVVDQLSKYNLKDIGFSGGEAILNTNFSEMVDYVASKKIKFAIVSNAWAYEKYIPIIQKNNLWFKGFHFSLDGLEENHDFLRRKGSFKKVMQAVYYLKMIKVKIGINFTVNNRNYMETEDIIKLCIKTKIDQLKIGGILPSKINHKWLLDFKTREKIYEEIKQLKEKYDYRIDVTSSLLNPTNKFNFCQQLFSTDLTLNNKGEIIFCCDIPRSYSKLTDSNISFGKMIRAKHIVAQKIVLDRINKFSKDKLKVIDQSCYYCHKYFGLSVPNLDNN